MRTIRLIAIVLAALVGLVILGLVSLLIFVNPNDYRGRIQQTVEQKTGRPLTIGGKLELKVFPWIALSINDLTLGNPPGYGSAPFLKVHSASIGVKVLPLLAKRLEVSRIAIDGLNANLVSRGENNNWKDLTSSSDKPATREPSGGGSVGAASIAGVDVKNAALSLRDEVKKSTTTVSILSFHTGHLGAGARSRIDLQDFSLKATLLSQTDGEAPSQARPIPLELKSPLVAIDMETQTLEPATLDAKLGELSAVLSARGEKIFTSRDITGNISVPKVSGRQVLQSLGIAPPLMRDSHALSAVSLRSQYRLTAHAVELSSLELTVDDTHLTGSAGITDLDRKALAFDLSVNAINLDRYRAPAEPETAAHAAKPAASAAPQPTPLPTETLKQLAMKGNLRVGSATFSNVVFTDVATPLTADAGRIHLGPTTAHVYGGSYDGDVVLDVRPDPAQLSVTEHLHGVDIGAFMKAAYQSTRLVGHADANVTVNGVGNTNAAIMRSLSGKLDANVKQGAINGIDLTYAVQSASSLLKREIPARSAGPARTDFKSLQTSATIDKGVMHTDDLRMETDFLKVSGKGTLDLVTEALDYSLIAALPQQEAAPRARGGNQLAGLDVPLRITGTLSNPTVRPDLEALAKGQLRQQVQQKAGEVVKKQLGDKLKDLLPH